MTTFSLILRVQVIKIIKFYQRILSPDHSKWSKVLYPYGYCRFQPSCSEYAIKTIEKYGIVKGGIRAIWRVLRCNPFSRGGEDWP